MSRPLAQPGGMKGMDMKSDRKGLEMHQKSSVRFLPVLASMTLPETITEAASST